MYCLSALVSLLTVFASAVSAKPIHISRALASKPVSDIVVAPGFYDPAGGESYSTGSNQTAKWSTDDIPAEAANYTGSLYLGYGNETDNEHLDIAHPLAVGFRLTDGEVDYTVPSVEPRDSYFLVLIGDSGNKSPAFSITN